LYLSQIRYHETRKGTEENQLDDPGFAAGNAMQAASVTAMAMKPYCRANREAGIIEAGRSSLGFALIMRARLIPFGKKKGANAPFVMPWTPLFSLLTGK
jgi:hypothetical protein